jgi:hypothetical protein
MESNLIKAHDPLDKKSLKLVLDTGAIEGLEKIPVDVFDNVYLGEAHNTALVTERVFKYEISVELSELKYLDYVGYGINLSCRLQALAKANDLI